ncbi:T9SS type B sorting domain-containing protein [Changchengzhania lutea]|uniref:T9SS type B sorting domain-containing protein n=1 Tax=Changchengzhania lutea TaxID=2049305 RepID=UPI00163D4FD1|nr:T9SS type B sorting domain-containing protein [Changchengzhania lutea]
MIIVSNNVFAQLAVPFSSRLPNGSIKVKGDIVLIGNSIITGEGLSLPFNGNGNNNSYTGEYINVASGGDPSIFSSSTADLEINNSCKNIIYAGLYWASVYPLEVANNSSQQFQGTPRIEDWNQIKFKLPTGTFIDLVADGNADPTGEEDDIIFDGYDPVNINNSFKDSPIICYKNVTNLLQGLTEADGTYTVANLRATRGRRRGGCAAGWTLVVIYESPLLPSKFISLFDGYAGVQGSTALDIPVSGFQTLPAPLPVNAKIGVAALEGDLGISGDSFRFRASTSGSYTRISDALNSTNNFFNSKITNNGAYMNNRNPNSTNVLGYDIANVIIPNPDNSVLPNDATAGDLRLTTSGDGYGAFVTSFAVDIIEPNIVLTKIVQDEMGMDIGGEVVDLGDQLNYVIGFQNIGNDDATDFTIRDILPTNINFNYPSDIDPLPAGVTIESYDDATREIIFRVDDSLVEEFGPVTEIRFSVQVVEFCNQLNDACSDSVSNQAFATYRSELNPSFIISDDPSYDANNGCLLSPQATNFLADIANCTYYEEVILCGASTTLTAPDGYDSYEWSSSPSGTPIIGTTQTITITSTGTYYVRNTALAPCQSTNQEVEVITFGADVENPVIPYADQLVTCPNDGKQLPNIFLCGGAGGKFIQTNLTDTTSLIWEKLDEASCAAVIDQDCANEDPDCSWNQVATGPDYMADTAGQYRLTLNYPGGCFNQFYFNIYTNLLTPTVTKRDIFCTTQGEIVVGGVPSGYEYSIDGTNYQSSNTFVVTVPDLYTVYIKQVGVSPNPCIFTVPDVQIRARDFTVSTIINQPFCNGDLGNVVIAVNDVRPQYFYSISQGGTLVNSVGPIVDRDYTFSNLNPGTYTIDISTEDGCVFTDDVQIIDPPLLEATSALTTPLTCTDGEITIYPVGGTPPYFYFLNGSTDFETIPTIAVTAPGTFDVRVVDSNNCSAQTSITVDQIPEPDFNVSKIDVLCYGDSSGEIQFNVTNANGYAIEYSIDNGVTYVANPTFSNLVAGTYQTVIRYSLNGNECFSTPEAITITQPAAAVTATAEVTELAGCGPTGEGRISITNPQGGVTSYEYSFDNQTTWATTNEAYLDPGTYTVYIRDANGCVFPMTDITIEPEPVAPTIDISDPDFNCDGTANLVVTVTNSGTNTFTYTYLIDGFENTNTADPTTFLNVTAGSHTISVSYQLQSGTTSCIKQSDFPIVIGSGNAFTASIVSATDVTCAGANDGTITISAQNFDSANGFQYALDGVTWITQMTSPYTITGLADGSYSVQMRYDSVVTGCDFTFNQDIDTPMAVSVNASATAITCLDGSTVTATATGGTAAYSYELLNTSLNLVSNFPSNGVLTNVGAGDYIIRVTDANGCTETTTLNLINPTPPTATIINADYCYDAANGASLEVSASGGQPPYEYNINGSAFQTDPVFGNLASGTYTIIVRDAYGCTLTLPVETIAPQVSVNVTLTKELDCTSSPNAVITGTISNGYTPYMYAVSFNGGAYTDLGAIGTSFTYNATTDGTYQFQVTDDNGCQVVSNVITVNPISNPTATTTVVNPSCNGDANGSVQIIPADGVGPYTYRFDGSAFTSTSSYTGLSAGTYAYEVRDTKDCIFTGSVILTEPTVLIASASVTTFSCDAANTKQSAVVTINLPTTGTAPYLYSFNGSGYSSNNALTVNDNGTDQIITYAVQDAQGCTAGGSVTILQLNPPTDLDFTSTEITCTATTSTVNLTATDGVGPLEYETISPSPIIVAKQTSNSFSGLTEGTYVFRVTDANGCYYTESYTIDPVINITVSGLLLSDVGCNGGADGSGEFTVSNFASTYSYTINGGTATVGQTALTIPLTGLSAGDQIIVVTDETTGCTATETITVSEPTNALSITSVNAKNVNCNDFNSQITVTATGGTTSYTYAAVVSTAPAPVTYASSNVINVDTNSTADLVWDVYVQDANGCIEQIEVTITLDPLPTVTTPPLASNQCSVNSGFTFTAAGADGVPPYDYSINGGASYQASSTFTVNTPGTYTVTIRDANGCTNISSTPTVVYAPITTSALLTKDITCSPVPTDASIDITVAGGNAPYTYEVSTDGGTTYTSIAGSPYTTLTAGNYQFRITDANSCTRETNVVTVNATVSVTVSTTPIDPTCNGSTDGSIQLAATAGEPPFTYSIDGGTTFVSSNVFGGLAAGNYDYVVRDNKGCDGTGTLTLTDPDPILANIDLKPIECNANTPGSIDVNLVSGGIAPFEYTLFDNAYTVLSTYTETNASPSPVYTFSGLNFGDYYITIVDANGCEFNSGKLRIETPPFLQLTGFVDSSNCATGVDYTVNTSGGIGPFRYSIFGQPATETAPIASASYTFTGLSHGITYFLQVKDVNDCISILEATMPPPPSNIVITNTITTDVNCNGDTNGTINFTVEDYDPTVTDIDYQILNALTLVPVNAIQTLSGPAGGPVNGSVTNLAAGNYVLQVTEASGTLCSNAFTFDITQPSQAITSAVTNNVNANCNSGALVTLTTSGGTGPYQYAAGALGFTPVSGDFGTSNVLNLDPSIRTNWDIVVIDANDCPVTVNETIASDPNPTINPVPQECFDGTPFNITLVEATGTAITPLTYSIGGAYQSSDTFTIGSASTYNLTIRDGNGCIATTTYVVETSLLLDANMTQDLTCAADASIILTPSGGTGTYSTYEVNINSGGYAVIPGSPYTTTTDGTYQFRVTDSQGCQAESAEIIVTPRTTPTLTEVHTDVTCNGGADGSIVVTATSGIAPYQYSNDNGTSFQSSNVFSGLAQGTYDIVVRDSKSCVSLTVPVTIDEPTLVGGSGALNQGLACGAGNATQPAEVEIFGSGGTAPYTYSFDGGVNYTSTNTYSTYVSGTVSAYVKDANGCIIVTPIDVVVPALDIPTDLDFMATAVTCTDLDSDVTLTTTNGVGPLSYAIIAPASATGNTSGDTTGDYTGLVPDTYTFTVTDANGCNYTESYTVAPVTNITVSGLLVSNVSCNGGSDGAVDFTVGNYSSTYSYTINGTLTGTGETSSIIQLTGLSIGDQIIVVTDEVTNCTATFTVNVSEPIALSLAETININAHCNFGAQVTVEANGGTPNYLYAFVENGNVPNTSDYTSSASAVLDPAVNVNWDVWVIDSNDCTDQIDVVIDTDPLPTVTVPALTSNQCNLVGDPYTFTVIGTTGVAPFTYSIGNGFQSSTAFTVSTPGDYFVTVRDANGCEAISATSVTVYPALDASPAVTMLPSCSDNDGMITMTGSGGSGNYTYTISPTAGSISGNVISGLPAGIYTVTITDATTTCTRNISVTVDAPTPVTFTTTPTVVSCNGGNDGIITVNLPTSNDNPIYTYSLDGGATTQTSNVFFGLIQGTYNITVTSGRNCTLTQSETVGEPNAIIVPTPTVLEYACTVGTNTTNFATITVSGVTEGSGTYTIYEFIKGGTILQSNANNVYTEADLSGGTYTINVYDDNGCLGTTTATIQPYIELDTLDITIDNTITCTNDEDITISVTSTGGTPVNLEYTVEDVDGALIGANYSQTNATGIFTSLPIGNYAITVINLDTSCSIQTVHYVNEPNTFDFTIDNVVDVTCFSDSDGRVDITLIDRVPIPTDESGAFDYTIVDGLGNPVISGTVPNAGPTSISGLVSGTYTLTASLANTPFCTISKNFTITAPAAALSITETHTEITCISGNNDGSISASATGGWPGAYEYQLELTGGTVVSSYSTVFDFTDLTAGDYTVNVRDSQGCIASTNVVLVIPTPIDAQVTATPALVSCFGDTNVSITVSNVTGGQGSNYTYRLNMVSPTLTSSGPQTSNMFNGLGAGTYNVTVRDGYNCEFITADVVIAEPSLIQARLVKATSQTCLTNATLTLSATGGTGPYEYSETMDFSTVIGPFTSDVTFPVTPETYQYYVRDANGCSSGISNEITIDPLPALTVNLDLTNATINCTGDITGVIVAEAQGGLGNYIYILQDGSGTDITPAPTQDTPGVFTELPAGTYQVRVTSGVDCEAVSTQVEITEPAFALQVTYSVTDVTCSGGNDGIMEIIATGGTGIIKYAISPQLNQFFDSPIFEDLVAGTYQAIAQDELGCFVLIDFNIDEPDPVILSIVPNSIIPEACEGDLDGEFSVAISGGSMPYSVSLDDINGNYTTGALTQTQFDFTGLAGGDHVVYVRDNLGCEFEWNITFPESVRIEAELDIAYCTDNTDATSNMVTVTVDDTFVDLTDLDYALNGGAFQLDNTFIDIAPGNHYITVRHTNTCEVIIDFEIEQFDPLQLAIADGNLNEIVATATGGSGVYEYEVQYEFDSSSEPYGNTNTFIIYKSGNYTVTVTDSNGCTAVATGFFEYIDVCISNYFVPQNGGWGPGCTSQYRNLTVDIFDRYGRNIERLHVDDKWYGNYNGKKLPSGDYWYLLKLNDPKDDREFMGHFTLYR